MAACEKLGMIAGVWALGLVLLLSAPPDVGVTAARLRLHVDVAALGLTHERWVGTDTTGGFGVGGHELALGLGYGLSRHLGLGVSVGVANPSTRRRGLALYEYVRGEVPHAELTDSYRLRALMTFALRPGRRVRPFAFVHGGVGIFNADLVDGATREYFYAIGPSVGGGLGLHAFVLPRASFDLLAELDYTTTRVPSYRQVSAQLGLGVSVFVGRKPRAKLAGERRRQRRGSPLER